MCETRKRSFVLRESKLTELFGSNKDMQSALNLCFSIFLILLGTNISYYLIDVDSFHADLIWLNWVFGGKHFKLLIGCWIKLQATVTIGLHLGVRVWLMLKSKSLHHNRQLSLFSVALQLYIFWIAFDFVRQHYISPVCSFIILIEQVRLSMKVHSFIEENRDRQIEIVKDKKVVSKPTLGQLIYFLYAPTLIYRDNYIRTQNVSWKLVFWYFSQVLAIMFTTFATSWRFVEHNYRSTGIKPYEIKQLIYLLLSGSLVGMQMCVLMFYGLLHCWLNAFAEMLRFGDRLFYSDWWNSDDFGTYYRKWNIVVHEWLRTYIFEPSLKITSRGKAALLVFLVSAIIHEYLLALSFGYFLPVLFSFFFIIGVLLYFIGKVSKFKDSDRKTTAQSNRVANGIGNKYRSTSLSLGNIIMFFGLNLGWGLMVMLYSMEWYSRINCPVDDNLFVNFFIPRLWSCATIK